MSGSTRNNTNSSFSSSSFSFSSSDDYCCSTTTATHANNCYYYDDYYYHHYWCWCWCCWCCNCHHCHYYRYSPRTYVASATGHETANRRKANRPQTLRLSTRTSPRENHDVKWPSGLLANVIAAAVAAIVGIRVGVGWHESALAIFEHPQPYLGGGHEDDALDVMRSDVGPHGAP